MQSCFGTLFYFYQNLFKSLLLSTSMMVSLAYLKLLIFLPPIFILLSFESSSVFHMMCSVYKLNKWEDKVHLCLTPLPVGNHSVSLYSILTVASWPQCRLHGRTIKCWGLPISFRATHSCSWSTVNGFTVVYERKTNRLLKFFGALSSQLTLSIRPSVPLPFLSPDWTSSISCSIFYTSLT